MANNEYPKTDTRGNRVYVMHPIQKENGKWVCAFVLKNGYSTPPWLVEFNTEELAKKACDAHNKYHGWTKKEVYKITYDSMCESIKQG